MMWYYIIDGTNTDSPISISFLSTRRNVKSGGVNKNVVSKEAPS